VATNLEPGGLFNDSGVDTYLDEAEEVSEIEVVGEVDTNGP